LRESGLVVTEEPFEFSEFPGRFAVPIIGLLLIIVVLFTVHVYWSHGGAGPAVLVLALGVLLVMGTARWFTRRGPFAVKSMRLRSVNLVARKGEPTAWLVAHLDSKSQTIPMLVRIASVVFVVICLVVMAAALVSAWLVALAGDLDWAQAELFLLFALLTVLGVLPLTVCFTRNTSPGAADNASGVISVLLAARELASRPNVGVVITSGEELGLAGARAHAAAHPERAIALNCDTIDDSGRFLCMTRGEGRQAVGAVRSAAQRQGVRVKVQPMLPGILADSMAFADAGWDAITLSRGNIGTLGRVHTSRDNLVHLNGTGIAQAAHLLAAAVEELT
jgi:hypothetical protein